MRLLYLWTDHVGRRALERTMRARGRGRERIHERQHLSLRCVSKHRGRDSKCSKKIRMKIFALNHTTDPAQAGATPSKAETAQQGAEIRFIGGGTTLRDLMRLHAEQPRTEIYSHPPPPGQNRGRPD